MLAAEAARMILFGSNADTELLALRSSSTTSPGTSATSAGSTPTGSRHPRRSRASAGRGAAARRPRPVGGRRSPLLRRAVRRAGVPLVALGGRASARSRPAAASTVPAGVAVEAHRYLAAGGPANVANLVRFLADTVLMTGFGFDPPRPVPDVGVWDGAGIGAPGAPAARDRPLVAVVFYRAHLVAGNTTSSRDLCGALEVAGADVLAIWTYSLRATPTARSPR